MSVSCPEGVIDQCRLNAFLVAKYKNTTKTSEMSYKVYVLSTAESFDHGLRVHATYGPPYGVTLSKLQYDPQPQGMPCFDMI